MKVHTEIAMTKKILGGNRIWSTGTIRRITWSEVKKTESDDLLQDLVRDQLNKEWAVLTSGM